MHAFVQVEGARRGGSSDRAPISSVMRANTIHYMENGRIVESGLTAHEHTGWPIRGNVSTLSYTALKFCICLTLVEVMHS